MGSPHDTVPGLTRDTRLLLKPRALGGLQSRMPGVPAHISGSRALPTGPDLRLRGCARLWPPFPCRRLGPPCDPRDPSALGFRQ